MADNLIVRALKRVGNAIVDVSLKAMILSVGVTIFGAIAVVWIALRGNPHGPWFYAAAGALGCALMMLLIGVLLVALRLRKSGRSPLPQEVAPENGFTQSQAKLALSEQELRRLQAQSDESEWLREIAKDQAQTLYRFVSITDCRIGKHELFRHDPYMEFLLIVWNRSIYDIALVEIAGSTSFNGRELTDPLQWKEGSRVLTWGNIATFTFRQNLTKDDVGHLLNGHAHFDFNRLEIKAEGVGGFASIVVPRMLGFDTVAPTNDDLLSAHPKLKIEIQEYQLRRYWKYRIADNATGRFPLDVAGSTINLKVRLTNPRNEQIEVSGFKLDTLQPEKRRTSAKTGTISEKPATGVGAEGAHVGAKLEPNLNECPFQTEPGTPAEGWLQFIILDLPPEEFQNSTPTLVVTDSRSIEHPRLCAALPPPPSP